MKKVLFVGESWSATLMEVKGFNSFLSSKYETGLGWIDKAIEKAGYEFVYMPNHIANDHFPFTLEELNEYSCIILSDVGADTHADSISYIWSKQNSSQSLPATQRLCTWWRRPSDDWGLSYL